MGLSARLLRLPRPQKFIYTMSLTTGASLITLTLVVNKVSGVYGVLALLTGYELSPLQLSMYIYSVFAFALTLYLAPHIRAKSPMQCLLLAWFYVLDSLVNAAYTAAFASSWFLVLLQHSMGQSTEAGTGAGTMDQTAGFTDPKYNVSRVEVAGDGTDAVAAGVPASAPAGAKGNNSLGDAIFDRDGINSISIIVTMWTIRIYFCLIMLSFARMVLRQHIAANASKGDFTSASKDTSLAENPFTESKPEGQGWKGRLGRFMVSIGRTYWLGAEDNDAWMVNMNTKFVKGGGEGYMLQKVDAGPQERERRRRTGTGPPIPVANLKVTDGKTLHPPESNV